MRRIIIVEPREDASEATRSLFTTLLPGSVAVAQEVSERSTGALSGALIHYEGGKYTRQQRDGKCRPPTDDERREYAIIAAGRLDAHYPTTSFFYIPHADAMQELREVGYVDVDDWKVVFYE